MWVTVYKDIDEIICSQDLYDHPIVEVFGEDAVGRYVESCFSMCEESDIGEAFADPNYQVEIIARLVERRKKPLTADEVKTLGVSIADLKAEGVPMEDPTIKVIIESAAQMKLFPEMEVNLPPYMRNQSFKNIDIVWHFKLFNIFIIFD